MKSFHLSGPKFDIAVEMFCMVEFSNFLIGQKFAAVEFEFSIRGLFKFVEQSKIWCVSEIENFDWNPFIQ